MTVIRLNEPIRAVLLDIEGTTTPIDFVSQVLFPYARRHVADYLARHLSDEALQADLAGLRAEHSADIAQGLNPPALRDESTATLLETAVTYLHWLIDRDRKSTPLKSLEGKIWEEGFRTDELKSEVFADVPRALARWHRQHRRICIYSSGSVLAQQLLFAHTAAGDLTGLISNFFDTRIGAKKEAESYRRIADALQLPPATIVFISDVTAELEAAHAVGLQCLLSMRPGNPLQPPSEMKIEVASFDEILRDAE